MNSIMTLIFVITMTICILSGLKLVSIMIPGNNTIDFNMPILLTPSNTYLMIPAVMFQVYFWFERAGVIV